jgi:hypothetical protein
MKLFFSPFAIILEDDDGEEEEEIFSCMFIL